MATNAKNRITLKTSCLTQIQNTFTQMFPKMSFQNRITHLKDIYSWTTRVQIKIISTQKFPTIMPFTSAEYKKWPPELKNEKKNPH